MMDDLHIIDFGKDVCRILLMLHRQFPRQQELYIGDLIGFEEPDEYGLYSKRHESCLQTLIWLKTEGWIRFNSIVRREAVDQCVLTQQGFVALHKSLPPAIVQAHFPPKPNSDLPSLSAYGAPRLLDGLYLANKAQDSAAQQATVLHLLTQGHV